MPKTKNFDDGRWLNIVVTCMHCESKMNTRSSRSISKTLREVIYVCTDPTCGFSCVSNLEIVRTLSPSAMPDPEVILPYTPKVRPPAPPAKTVEKITKNKDTPTRIVRQEIKDGHLVRSTVVTMDQGFYERKQKRDMAVKAGTYKAGRYKDIKMGG